jgi:carbon storage regulator
MLVISRPVQGVIQIGDSIRIQVVSIGNGSVRIGIEAPRDVPVHRQEVYEAIQRENSVPKVSNSP